MGSEMCIRDSFLRDLDAGLYTLEVSRKSGFTGDQDFAVAFTIAVPEPGSALVLILGSMGLVLRRRSRPHHESAS